MQILVIKGLQTARDSVRFGMVYFLVTPPLQTDARTSLKRTSKR